MISPSQDRRDVRHYILTVGRNRTGQPVREMHRLTRGTPALLAFQDYKHIKDDDLELIIRDLVSEQERREAA